MKVPGDSSVTWPVTKHMQCTPQKYSSLTTVLPLFIACMQGCRGASSKHARQPRSTPAAAEHLLHMPKILTAAWLAATSPNNFKHVNNPTATRDTGTTFQSDFAVMHASCMCGSSAAGRQYNSIRIPTTCALGHSVALQHPCWWGLPTWTYHSLQERSCSMQQGSRTHRLNQQ